MATEFCAEKKPVPKQLGVAFTRIWREVGSPGFYLHCRHLSFARSQSRERTFGHKKACTLDGLVLLWSFLHMHCSPWSTTGLHMGVEVG